MAAFTQLFSKLMSEEELTTYIKEGRLVIDTCEFMRGTTWDDTYVIIDEAQNCTFPQIKMLMSRMGKNSKLVMVGDAEQTDLWDKLLIGGRSPFAVCMDRLYDEDDDIGVVELEDKDIVRNSLIGKIIKLLGNG